jgi:type I restriction enzyme S subunit
MSEAELPEGWAEANLFDISEPKQWPTISTKELTPTGYPVYGANGRIGFYEDFNHAEPTVLITCRGATCGTLNICEAHSYVTGNSMALDGIPPGGIDLNFLFAALQNRGLDDAISGSAQPQITRANLRVVGLPIAPFAEQRRIVEKGEALLAQVSAARARLAKVPTILKRFRQSILSAACAGRLTDGCEDDEWTSTDLQSIAMIGTGSTPLRSNKTFYAEKGTPWITSAATSLPIVTHADEFVTEAAVSAHRLKKYPIGTLLVAMYGEGKTRGQVTELGIEAAVNQACSAIVVDGSKALSSFVKLVLQANYLSMREMAEGGNQPNLSLGKMKELPISVPPLAEQHEIVRRVDSLFKLADAIEARVVAATARADRITQAILAKAFRGELVPTEAELARQEGRDYEPASALLARIRAARADNDEKPTRRPRATAATPAPATTKPGRRKASARTA